MGSPMSIPLWLALGDVVILGKVVNMFLDVDDDVEMLNTAAVESQVSLDGAQ